MRVTRKRRPSGKKREKANRHQRDLLPYLTAVSFAKLVLECVKLLIDLLKSR